MDYLNGDVPLVRAGVRPGIERLGVILNDRPVANASELLSSPETVALIEEVKRGDDRIAIFDMPPVFAGDDVLAFAPLVDAVLIVLSQGTTKRAASSPLRELLQNVNVIGTVLNRSSERVAPYYYGPALRLRAGASYARPRRSSHERRADVGSPRRRTAPRRTAAAPSGKLGGRMIAEGASSKAASRPDRSRASPCRRARTYSASSPAVRSTPISRQLARDASRSSAQNTASDDHRRRERETLRAERSRERDRGRDVDERADGITSAGTLTRSIA